MLFWQFTVERKDLVFKLCSAQCNKCHKLTLEIRNAKQVWSPLLLFLLQTLYRFLSPPFLISLNSGVAIMRHFFFRFKICHCLPSFFLKGWVTGRNKCPPRYPSQTEKQLPQNGKWKNGQTWHKVSMSKAWPDISFCPKEIQTKTLMVIRWLEI